MIIMKYWGGLGNQLFIYALTRELEYKGIEVKADIINLLDRINQDVSDNKSSPDKYVLDELGIQLDFVTDTDFYQIQKSIKNKLKWFYNTIIGRNRKKYFYYFNSYVEKRRGFDSDVFNTDNTYLFGFWQSPKYFKDVKEQIKKEIKIPIQGNLDKLVEEFEKCNSVSIHMRLGDYLDEKNAGFGMVCANNYYANAIEFMKSNITDPVFYVFSNDTDLAKEKLSSVENKKIIFMDRRDMYSDFYLIGKCKHHIISNSSYGWWSAWLGETSDTVTVAPEIWHMDDKDWDIYEDNWHKIKI